MGSNPEMEDRFMGEILADFYKRASKLDDTEEFSFVLSGDQDGTFKAVLVAGGDTVLAKGSSTSWFEAISRAAARGLVAIEVIQERIAAANLED
jgi:hypothetical protein